MSIEVFGKKIYLRQCFKEKSKVFAKINILFFLQNFNLNIYCILNVCKIARKMYVQNKIVTTIVSLLNNENITFT